MISNLATIIGSEGYAIQAPNADPPMVGCCLHGDGDQLAWSLRPPLLQPAVGPTSNSQVLTPVGWTDLPAAVVPAGSGSELQYRNGANLGAVSGSSVDGSGNISLGGYLNIGAADTRLTRFASGPAAQIQADGGLRVQNLLGNSQAPVDARNITTHSGYASYFNYIYQVAGDSITIGNTASTRINLGGFTNAYPALKRNATGLDIRLADDSTFANISAACAKLYPQATTDKGLVVKAVASYASNFIECQDSTGASVFQVDQNGAVKMKAASNIGTGLGVELTTEAYRDLVVTTTLTNQSMAILGQLEVRPRTGVTSKILMGNMSAGSTPVLQAQASNLFEITNSKTLFKLNSGATGNGIELQTSGGATLFAVDVNSAAKIGIDTRWNRNAVGAFAHECYETSLSAWQTGHRQEASASGIKESFFGATPILKPSVTGSRGGNAALASLLTSLANLGLVIDSTSA